ncbi:orotate phosphoribosyltransferase [Clostridia bacterium]|nr:orotate phosphoribosyltransferase [Clostridia bacterium]
METNYKSEFIRFMVRANVLMFGDFITKSGRNTPYFINTGNYKTGEQIKKLGEYYAASILENIKCGRLCDEITALFGPAYKGIPLAVSASIALADRGVNVNYCFNRKELKDHGEGGGLVGYPLKDGDAVLIIEDVLTAGTALRECLPVLKSAADVNIGGLIISVDRMEKGGGDKTASKELHEEFDITTFSIVTVRDVLEELYNNPIDGVVYIDDDIRNRMMAYFEMYCEM